MGKQPKKKVKAGGQANMPLAIFATVLVVAGIAGAAYLSYKQPKPEAKPAPAAPAPAATSAEAARPSGTVVMANADSVVLVYPSGKTERLSTDAFWALDKADRLPAEGSNAANGSGAFLLSPEQASGTRETFLSPDRRYIARLGEPKRDNAAALEIVQGREAPQTIVLRDRRGKALTDTVLLGWIGPRTLAVLAVATSSRCLFAAELNGTLRQIAQVPDDIVYAEARGGAVWYATAQLGEGLESTPKGPSELHRVTSDGQDMLAARDDLRVFQVAVPDGKGHLMYTTDDGQSFYLTVGDEKTRLALGKRRPLGYFPDGNLLLRDGYGILSLDPEDGRSLEISAVPEGEVKAFVLP